MHRENKANPLEGAGLAKGDTHDTDTVKGVDWTAEQLQSVRMKEVDANGVVLQEVLCSTADQRCIAFDVLAQGVGLNAHCALGSVFLGERDRNEPASCLGNQVALFRIVLCLGLVLLGDA